MRRGPVAAAAAVAVGLGPASAACSGDTGGTECSCEDPTVHVEVPADRAPYVASVALSGKACASSSIACTQPVGTGCAEYAFQATAEGTCDLEIQFSLGPADFQEQLTFAQTTCCPGFYVQPATASPVEVPDVELDGGDAG